MKKELKVLNAFFICAGLFLGCKDTLSSSELTNEIDEKINAVAESVDNDEPVFSSFSAAKNEKALLNSKMCMLSSDDFYAGSKADGFDLELYHTNTLWIECIASDASTYVKKIKCTEKQMYSYLGVDVSPLSKEYEFEIGEGFFEKKKTQKVVIPLDLKKLKSEDGVIELSFKLVDAADHESSVVKKVAVLKDTIFDASKLTFDNIDYNRNIVDGVFNESEFFNTHTRLFISEPDEIYQVLYGKVFRSVFDFKVEYNGETLENFEKIWRDTDFAKGFYYTAKLKSLNYKNHTPITLSVTDSAGNVEKISAFIPKAPSTIFALKDQFDDDDNKEYTILFAAGDGGSFSDDVFSHSLYKVDNSASITKYDNQSTGSKRASIRKDVNDNSDEYYVFYTYSPGEYDGRCNLYGGYTLVNNTPGFKKTEWASSGNDFNVSIGSITDNGKNSGTHTVNLSYAEDNNAVYAVFLSDSSYFFDESSDQKIDKSLSFQAYSDRNFEISNEKNTALYGRTLKIVRSGETDVITYSKLFNFTVDSDNIAPALNEYDDAKYTYTFYQNSAYHPESIFDNAVRINTKFEDVSGFSKISYLIVPHPQNIAGDSMDVLSSTELDDMFESQGKDLGTDYQNSLISLDGFEDGNYVVYYRLTDNSENKNTIIMPVSIVHIETDDKPSVKIDQSGKKITVTAEKNNPDPGAGTLTYKYYYEILDSGKKSFIPDYVNFKTMEINRPENGNSSFIYYDDLSPVKNNTFVKVWFSSCYKRTSVSDLFNGDYFNKTYAREAVSYPVYIYSDPTKITCNKKMAWDDGNGKILIMHDQPCFVQIIASKNNFKNNGDEWERRSIAENRFKIEMFNGSATLNSYDADDSVVPDGYYYAVVVHYADGTCSVPLFSKKQAVE